jgi:hypothetical protein
MFQARLKVLRIFILKSLESTFFRVPGSLYSGLNIF